MSRSLGRDRSSEARGGGTAGGRSDAFGRVFELLSRSAEGRISVRQARERFSDVVRLAGRLRRLQAKLGKGGVASMSPYLESLLRLATEPQVVEPTELRRAANF